MSAYRPCETCGSPILWAITEGGKLIPLDPDPVENGNLSLTGRSRPSSRGGVVEVASAAAASLFDESVVPRYVSHFATCPFAEEHRRARPASRVDRAEVGGGRSRTDHPETSKRAGALVRSGSQHAACLSALARLDDATAYELAASVELAAVRPGISANQVGSRLAELRDRGLVERSPFDQSRHVEAVDGIGARRAATGPALCHRLTSRGRVEEGRLR